MSIRTARATAVLLAALALHPAAPAWARLPADLKLRDAADVKVLVSPRPNPHDRFACAECHLTTPTGKRDGAGREAPTIKNDYPDELCARCHPGCDLHPSGADPRARRPGMAIPGYFPLRSLAEGKLKVACLTCHDIHFPHTGFSLLRGYQLNAKPGAGPFATRLDFCRACHGRQLNLLSPHRRGAGATGCTFCHARKPEGNTMEPLRAGINDLCSFCHAVYPAPHYYQCNPFPELSPEAIADSGVPLAGGTYTCATCHQAHGSTPLASLLRPEYLRLAGGATRIDPHGRKSFCPSCHSSTPAPGAQSAAAPLLVDDVVALCNRCHAGGRITGMYHPLTPLKSGYTKPRDLPLGPGEGITCGTCHLEGHDPATPANPAFLRGNPFQGIRQLCRQCHPQTDSATRNPHREYDQELGCELCHREGSTFTTKSLKVGPTRADDNFVCLQCHDGSPHPANTRHTIRPGQYPFVSIDRKAYPLDRFGRITCYTCHQTHQLSSTPLLLRTEAPGRVICNGCHPF